MLHLPGPGGGQVGKSQVLRRCRVDWETIRNNWTEMRSRLQGEWPDLTEEDLSEIGGSRERLLEKLRARYFWSREEAEAQLEGWADREEEYYSGS